MGHAAEGRPPSRDRLFDWLPAVSRTAAVPVAVRVNRIDC